MPHDERRAEGGGHGYPHAIRAGGRNNTVGSLEQIRDLRDFGVSDDAIIDELGAIVVTEDDEPIDHGDYVPAALVVHGAPTPELGVAMLITGLGEPGAHVAVLLDADEIAARTVGGDGTWSIDLSGLLDPGSVDLVVAQRAVLDLADEVAVTVSVAP